MDIDNICIALQKSNTKFEDQIEFFKTNCNKIFMTMGDKENKLYARGRRWRLGASGWAWVGAGAGGDLRGCVAQMSFGGHIAKEAADKLQKQLQEMADEEKLNDGMAGMDIPDVKVAEKMAMDLESIQSSASAMALEEARAGEEAQDREVSFGNGATAAGAAVAEESLRCPLTRSSTTRLSLTLWLWVRSMLWRSLTIAPSGGLCSGAMSISRGSKYLLQRKSWTRTNRTRPGRNRPSRRKTLVLLRAYALRLPLRLALRRRLLPSLIRIRV
jgi:hypothetical protein